MGVQISPAAPFSGGFAVRRHPLRAWWNGRHKGLKSPGSHEHASSNLAARTSSFQFRSVAQPGSASRLGREGREFEPLHSDHLSLSKIEFAGMAELVDAPVLGTGVLETWGFEPLYPHQKTPSDGPKPPLDVATELRAWRNGRRRELKPLRGLAAPCRFDAGRPYQTYRP